MEYWSGLPCPPPGDLPDPGIEPTSLPSSALADGFFTTSATWEASAAAAKSLQSCPTVCDPIDSSLPGCPVPGILQARTLEWGAIAFSALILWAPVIPHHQNPSRSQLARVPCDAAHRNQPLAGLRVWVGVQIEDNHLQICLKNCHPDGISG